MEDRDPSKWGAAKLSIGLVLENSIILDELQELKAIVSNAEISDREREKRYYDKTRWSLPLIEHLDVVEIVLPRFAHIMKDPPAVDVNTFNLGKLVPVKGCDFTVSLEGGPNLEMIKTYNVPTGPKDLILNRDWDVIVRLVLGKEDHSRRVKTLQLPDADEAVPLLRAHLI